MSSATSSALSTLIKIYFLSSLLRSAKVIVSAGSSGLSGSVGFSGSVGLPGCEGLLGPVGLPGCEGVLGSSGSVGFRLSILVCTLFSSRWA
ncbi:MAG: hypothetical protein IJR51_08435 [Clostridia bacterium]|nr:hypothetical protein [Clostridia bacterium]